MSIVLRQCDKRQLPNYRDSGDITVTEWVWDIFQEFGWWFMVLGICVTLILIVIATIPLWLPLIALWNWRKILSWLNRLLTIITHPTVVIGAILFTVVSLALVDSLYCDMGDGGCHITNTSTGHWFWENFLSKPWWTEWHFLNTFRY